MKLNTVTSAVLYDLVWSKPMTKVAKELSYSDNGLRKICIKHNIPMPRVGYWSKIKFGKKVQKTKLPKGKNVIELSLHKIGRKDPVQSNSIRSKVKKELEESKELNFIVPKNLLKPDQLIREAKKSTFKTFSRWQKSQDLRNYLRHTNHMPFGQTQ